MAHNTAADDRLDRAAEDTRDDRTPVGRTLRLNRKTQLGIIVSMAVAHYLLHASFTVDDADITFAYVRSFVDGHGLGVLHPGDLRVEGYSNLTWLLLLAGAASLGAPITVAAKVLGLLFTVGTVGLAHDIAWRLLANRNLAVGVVAASASVPFVLWSASGLETSLLVFLVVAVTDRLLVEDAHRDRAWWPSAVLAVALALTRPEGFIYALAAVIFMVARAGRIPAQLRRAGTWAASVCLALAAYATWHISFYGALFPNTVYAKVKSGGLLDSVLANLDPTGLTVEYAAKYALIDWAIFLAPLALFGAWAARRGPHLLLPIMTVAAVALPLREPDWMLHSRFYATSGVLLVLLAVIGLDNLAGARRLTRSAAVATLVLFTAANGVLAVQIDRSGYPLYITADEMTARYADLVAAGQRAGLDDPLLMVPDVGALAFEGQHRIVDAVGLTDYFIARHLGDAAALDSYVQQRQPDLVRLHAPHDTTSMPVDAMPGFARDYLPILTVQDQGNPRAWVRRGAITAPDTTPIIGAGGGVSIHEPIPKATGHDLIWSVSPREPVTARGFRYTLRNAAGGIVAGRADDLGYGWLPPTSWRGGEAVTTHMPFALPSGHTAIIELVDASGHNLSTTTYRTAGR